MNRFLAHAALGIYLLFSGIAYSEEVAKLGRIERLDRALDRQHLGTLATGVATANLAFGDDGSTLYLTADKNLVRVRTKVQRLVSCSGYGGAQSMKLLIDRRPVAAFRSGTLASMQPECSELRR